MEKKALRPLCFCIALPALCAVRLGSNLQNDTVLQICKWLSMFSDWLQSSKALQAEQPFQTYRSEVYPVYWSWCSVTVEGVIKQQLLFLLNWMS